MLEPHPQSPCPALRAVSVEMREAAGGWHLQYRFEGDIDALAVPERQPPVRRDGLWQHLCCEWFVLGADGRYCEFNVAPSGAWAAYFFEGYRVGARPAEVSPTAVQVHRERTELRVAMVLRPPADLLAPLRHGLSAVVEEVGGALSYWALRHPQARPDFHDPAGFVPLGGD